MAKPKNVLLNVDSYKVTHRVKQLYIHPKTARQMFEKGMRVKLTAEAFKSLLPKHNSHPTGTVVGFGRMSWLVRVRRDGIKCVETYHINFWERE